MLSLQTQAATLQNQIEYHDLFSCIKAEKRWDFISQTCMETRPWKQLPEHLKKLVNRPLTADEITKAKEDMKLFSPATISSEQTPHGIIVIGTAGAGKSSLIPSLSNWIPGFNENQYALLDGDILRKNHLAYQTVSSEETVAYSDAWKIVKPYFASIKKSILKQIINENRNVIIPTGVHSLRYYHELKEHGYRITLIGVYVDFQLARYRGLNRAEWTGRSYTGSFKHWQTGLNDMLSLAEIHKESIIIIDNNDFNHPKSMGLQAIASKLDP